MIKSADYYVTPKLNFFCEFGTNPEIWPKIWLKPDFGWNHSGVQILWRPKHTMRRLNFGCFLQDKENWKPGDIDEARRSWPPWKPGKYPVICSLFCKGTCHSAACMRQACDQKHFIISEVAADWHELMIYRSALLRPSIAHADKQLDPRSAASRHATAPICYTRPSPHHP